MLSGLTRIFMLDRNLSVPTGSDSVGFCMKNSLYKSYLRFPLLVKPVLIEL